MYNYSYPTTDTSALPLGGTYNVFLACVAYNHTALVVKSNREHPLNSLDHH